MIFEEYKWAARALLGATVGGVTGAIAGAGARAVMGGSVLAGAVEGAVAGGVSGSVAIYARRPSTSIPGIASGIAVASGLTVMATQTDSGIDAIAPAATLGYFVLRYSNLTSFNL